MKKKEWEETIVNKSLNTKKERKSTLGFETAVEPDSTATLAAFFEPGEAQGAAPAIIPLKEW